MTTTTPTTTSFHTPSRPSTPARWLVALVAGTVAVVSIGVGLAVTDGSEADAPVTPTVARGAEMVDEGAPAPVGPVSADAAERRAESATTKRCSGLSADAAERCMTAGR